MTPDAVMPEWRLLASDTRGVPIERLTNLQLMIAIEELVTGQRLGDFHWRTNKNVEPNEGDLLMADINKIRAKQREEFLKIMRSECLKRGFFGG